MPRMLAAAPTTVRRRGRDEVTVAVAPAVRRAWPDNPGRRVPCRRPRCRPDQPGGSHGGGGGGRGEPGRRHATQPPGRPAAAASGRSPPATAHQSAVHHTHIHTHIDRQTETLTHTRPTARRSRFGRPGASCRPRAPTAAALPTGGAASQETLNSSTRTSRRGSQRGRQCRRRRATGPDAACARARRPRSPVLTALTAAHVATQPRTFSREMSQGFLGGCAHFCFENASKVGRRHRLCKSCLKTFHHELGTYRCCYQCKSMLLLQSNFRGGNTHAPATRCYACEFQRFVQRRSANCLIQLVADAVHSGSANHILKDHEEYIEVYLAAFDRSHQAVIDAIDRVQRLPGRRIRERLMANMVDEVTAQNTLVHETVDVFPLIHYVLNDDLPQMQ